jgi:PLD-like domain
MSSGHSDQPFDGGTVNPNLKSRRSHRRLRFVLMAAIALVLTSAPRAMTAERMWFPAYENVADELIRRINAETVRLDISIWYLTEHSVSIAIANRFAAGVRVRLVGDRGAIFEIDPNTKAEFYFLANQGVPIRLRFNPTWFPEIDHMKMAIFVGQNVVEFGSANWDTFSIIPFSATNYNDETAFFTDDPVLVGAFKTRFDRIWNDTTPEPESIYGGPPYLKDWADACRNEPLGCDFFSVYPNPRPMVINTARLESDNATPPDLIWGQGPDFNSRLVAEINNENTFIQFANYRLTVDDVTNALLNRQRSGVPVRLIIEPNEYLNRRWPEFWLTHANYDKLWAAGVQIKQRNHDGNMHMKSLVTSTFATNASSNIAAGWQRDNDYFISAATKPTIYAAVRDRVTAMWNDSAGFVPFQPGPPDAADLSSPVNGASGVPATASLVWNRAVFATDYDVYLGTSPSSMSRVANVPAQLVNNPPSTYFWTPGSPLCTGTTYYWQIVSRTNATPVNPSLAAASTIGAFTTTGSPSCSGGGGLPSPWTNQDVGSTGRTGSASFASGTFTVSGAGANIWGTSDAFQYVSQSVNGDAQIVARVASIQNTNTFAKAGVMLRQSTAANAAHVILDVRPDGSIEFMTRSSTGGDTTYLAGAFQPAPAWLRLSRSGSTVTGSVSANGASWTTVGSITTAISSNATIGLAVTSIDTTTLNTSTFDNVTVGAGPPPPPPPAAPNIVIYASDVTVRNGSWTTASDSTSPNGIKLVTADAGFAQTSNPLAAPTDFFDVTFNANAGTPYTIWLRLQALANQKTNDSVWVQFSDATVGGSIVYPINTTSGLLVNLATDGTASSLNRWGWQNGAYWLSQPTTVSFANNGSHTLRIQVREDGVQLDQIVLSPSTYLNSAPGSATNDGTIVPKP